MKKRNIITLICSTFLIGATLTACSSNQSSSSQTNKTSQSVQSAEEVKPVGFIEMSNENTERIWFDADEIAKDKTITGLYVVKNGKATYYHLLTYTANSDVENGPKQSDNRLTFLDIENLSNKEIIAKAKKIDKEAYNSYYQSFADIIDKALQKWPNDEENKQYIPALENIKNSIVSLQDESAYKDYRKLVSEFQLSAQVKTDDTGNNVINEVIKLQIFPKYTADYLSSKSLVLNKDTQSLKINTSSFSIGEVYKSKYVSFGDSPLITRDLLQNTYPYFDMIDTKNVIEK